MGTAGAWPTDGFWCILSRKSLFRDSTTCTIFRGRTPVPIHLNRLLGSLLGLISHAFYFFSCYSAHSNIKNKRVYDIRPSNKSHGEKFRWVETGVRPLNLCSTILLAALNDIRNSGVRSSDNYRTIKKVKSVLDGIAMLQFLLLMPGLRRGRM